MNAAAVLEAINVLLAGIRLLNSLGINFREVIAAQELADAEGRELTDDERQRFIDEAQAAIDGI